MTAHELPEDTGSPPDVALDVSRSGDGGLDTSRPHDGGLDAADTRDAAVAPRDAPTVDAPRVARPRDPCAPRPIAPLSTSTTTTRQPTFRWEPGSSGTTRLEICSSRDCATVLDAVEVAAPRATSRIELPAGVVFWRLVATGATCAGAMGPTWQLTIPTRSAPVDASSGTTLDVNGDGYADVAVGASGAANGAGRVVLYAGGLARPGARIAEVIVRVERYALEGP